MAHEGEHTGSTPMFAIFLLRCARACRQSPPPAAAAVLPRARVLLICLRSAARVALHTNCFTLLQHVLAVPHPLHPLAPGWRRQR